MTDEIDSTIQGARRSIPARIGIAALNLQTPGLGLLRLGRLGPALLCWLLGIAPFLLIVLFWAASPVLGFRSLVACVAVIVIPSLTALLGSIVASWRWSRPAAPNARPIGSRWYAIVLAAVAYNLIVLLFVGAAHNFYKPFYIPSEAMMPTLLRNDRIVASMRVPKTLRRGDVILFWVGESTYVKRLAGLPGDRIAFVKGQVILNGRPVPQQAVGSETIGGPYEPQQATRLRERFPGEDGDHQIYDTGFSPQDDLPEQVVATGHVFVLGDNRDNSADSRVPRQAQGVEQLPMTDIRGIPLFYTWGPRHKSGQRVH